MLLYPVVNSELPRDLEVNSRKMTCTNIKMYVFCIWWILFQNRIVHRLPKLPEKYYNLVIHKHISHPQFHHWLCAGETNWMQLTNPLRLITRKQTFTGLNWTNQICSVLSFDVKAFRKILLFRNVWWHFFTNLGGPSSVMEWCVRWIAHCLFLNMDPNEF